MNVIVLFPKIEEAKSIRNLLVRSGINVTNVCTTGSQVIIALEDLEDGLVVCGYKYSDMMMYSELYEYLPDGFQMLLIASKMYYSECYDDNIMCLSMPIKSYELINTVNIMLDTLWRQRKKRKQQPKVRNEKEKAVIENAKQLLIDQKGYTEEEAHKYLQKQSMDNGTNIVETAYMVLELY